MLRKIPMKQFDTICTDFEKFCDFTDGGGKNKNDFFIDSVNDSKNYIVITRLFLSTLENFLSSNSITCTKNELLSLIFFHLTFLRIDKISAVRETHLSTEYNKEKQDYELQMSSNHIIDLNERLDFIIETINRIFNLKITNDYLMKFLFETHSSNMCVRNLCIDVSNYLHLNFFESTSLNCLFKLIDKHPLLSTIFLIKWDFETEKNLSSHIKKRSTIAPYFPHLLSVNYRIYKNKNRVDQFINMEKSTIYFTEIITDYYISLGSSLFKIGDYIYKEYKDMVVLLERRFYPGSTMYHSNTFFEVLNQYSFRHIILSELKDYITQTLELAIKFYSDIYKLEDYQEKSSFRPIKCFVLIKHLENAVNILKSEEFKRIVYENEYSTK